MKIYVASSWRNARQPEIVDALRAAGHSVYDFRHPEPGNFGFSWTAIDPNWNTWSPTSFIKALDHRIAEEGFSLDFTAMQWADVCVLVLPCGKSAHLELGWCAGAGKATAFLLEESGPVEPELMYKMADAVLPTLPDLLAWCAAVGALEEARQPATAPVEFKRPPVAVVDSAQTILDVADYLKEALDHGDGILESKWLDPLMEVWSELQPADPEPAA